MTTWRHRIPAPDDTALAALCRDHHVRGLWLFGSVLRDDFGSASDVDVLVEFEPEAQIGFLELARLADGLSALFGRAVDVVPVGGLKPALRDRVLSARELLYAA